MVDGRPGRKGPVARYSETDLLRWIKTNGGETPTELGEIFRIASTGAAAPCHGFFRRAWSRLSAMRMASTYYKVPPPRCTLGTLADALPAGRVRLVSRMVFAAAGHLRHGKSHKGLMSARVR